MDNNFNTKLLKDDIREEFNKKIIESQINTMLENKIKKLYESADSKYSEMCRKQIEDVHKYELLDKNQFENLSKDKKSQAEIAYKNLLECKKPFTILMNNYSFISQHSRTLFKLENDYCYEDCEKKYPEESSENELKKCMKNCCEHSLNYTHKAYCNLLESFTDSFNKMLDEIDKSNKI